MAPGWDEEFDSFLRDTAGHLRDRLAAMGVRPHHIDDLAQEAYLVFYRRGRERPADADAIAWLIGIARNLAREHFRRLGGRHLSLDLLLEPVAPPPDEEPVDERDRLAALRACLAELPEDRRTFLVRYHTGGEDAETLGAVLGRSANALRLLMLRLRESLRDCVQRRIGMHREGVV